MSTLTDEIREKFLDLACQLSPENLSCDGELTKTQVIQRLREIRREWRKYEAQIGMKITEDMVWDWERNKL